MPFKKLSRRTFLTASSALAFLHTPFARALPARQSVNINDYNPHDWIASFKQAFSEGQTVVVPAGLVSLQAMVADTLGQLPALNARLSEAVSRERQTGMQMVQSVLERIGEVK